MGLLKKAHDGIYGPEDFEEYEPAYNVSGPIRVASDHFRTDALDALGDRLLDAARATGRPKGSRRRTSAADSKMIATVKYCVRQEGDFVDLALQIARRLDPHVDAHDAIRLLGSAETVRLDAALSQDSLWAQLWPYVRRVPVMSALDRRAQARFARFLAAGAQRSKSVPSRVMNDPWIRRATEVVEAHQTLCGAFGRLALAIDPWRVYKELDLPKDPSAYEVLVILFNAHSRRFTVRNLPGLVGDVGLPSLAALPYKPFDAGWDVAAAIDPVAVLGLMGWCIDAWTTMPATATCDGLTIDDVFYPGARIPGSMDEWFGLTFVDRRWRMAHFLAQSGVPPGQWSGRLTVGNNNFVHACQTPDCDLPKWFHGVSSRSVTRVSAPSWWTARDRGFSGSRAHYGQLWSAGLLNMPVLTCPKEWELT